MYHLLSEYEGDMIELSFGMTKNKEVDYELKRRVDSARMSSIIT